MNITLWTAADAHIGIGHLRRTEALAQALRANGVTPRLLFQGDARLARLLACEHQPIQRVDDFDQVLLICAAEPGVLVSDLPGLRKEHSQRLRQAGCGPLVHLTDADGLRYQADVFLDGDALDKPGIAQRTGGAEYNILRMSLLTKRPSRPWRLRKIRRVLVCLGGADPGYCTESLLASWQRDVRLTLVAGPAVSVRRQRHWHAQLRHGDRLLRSPADLPGHLLRHDLVVTLGGITSYEAMCLGRPVAAVAWRHMSPYVRGMADAGLLNDLGSVQVAGRRLARLLRRPARMAQRAGRAFNILDGSGAERCAALIIRLALNANGSSSEGSKP